MRSKKFAFVMLGVSIAGVILSGCGKGQGKIVSETEAGIQYETESENISIDWDTIIANVKAADLGDLYIDEDEIESTVADDGFIAFSNYNPEVSGDFKNVKYQLSISYGETLKEDGTIYPEAMYDIFISDNESDQYYDAVYSMDGEKVFEEGNWFLDDDAEEYITGYIDKINEIMGVR